ncbi:hypothetical protein FOT82_22460 [Raoultella planticola]|nr:hypothetical protein [Raoultella planticola]
MLTGRNSGFSLAEDTDDLFVGKTLLHGDVLMWLMKTLLTSRCINQRGAGHRGYRNDGTPEQADEGDYAPQSATVGYLQS